MKRKFLESAVVLLAGLTAACGIRTCAAAPPYVHLSVQTDRAFINEPFPVFVLVGGTHPEIKQPDTSRIEDFRIRLLERSTGGEAPDRHTVFRYQFTPIAGGDLTIPALSLSVAGQSVSTEPVRLRVFDIQTTGRLQLAVKLSAAECRIGEPILMTVTWSSQFPWQSIRAVDMILPALRDPDFKIIDPDASFPVDPDQAMGMPVYGTRILARPVTEQIAGEKSPALTFAKIVLPRKTGTLTLAPAEITCACPETKIRGETAAKYPSYFDNTFFDKEIPGDFLKFRVKSNTPSLTVHPLPQISADIKFDGLFGQAGVNTSAEPCNVRTGEPIELTIKVKTVGFPESVPPPRLNKQPEFGEIFYVDSEAPSPTFTSDTAIFVRTIKPKHPKIDRIPPVAMTYFDPITEEYGQSRSKAIEIYVSPAPVLDIDDAETTAADRPDSQPLPWKTILLIVSVILVPVITAVLLIPSRPKNP